MTVATPLYAQRADSARVSGVVRSTGGAPIPGVNVFVLETLDGALSDSSGRFAFAARVPASVTLIARRIGFEQVTRRLTADSLRLPITISLTPVAASLAQVRVEASAYRVDNEQGSTLSTLDVVTTPGSAADVYRAIQLLPGLQSVDEGTGLYVRGGDFTETKIFLNDAVLLNPEQLQTPLGTFVGRIDPFQLDGIYFSSGGFGVRYGDALSGMAALRTLGIPDQREATLSVGIGHASIGGGLRAGRRGGVRFAGNLSDLRPFIRLNGAGHDYAPAPRSQDGSVSAMWRYRNDAQLGVFAMGEEFRLGVALDDASYSGVYRVRSGNRQSIVSWRDVRGRVTFTGSAAIARSRNEENYGIYQLTQQLEHAQVYTAAELAVGTALAVRAGIDAARLGTLYEGSLPAEGHDARPDARAVVFTADEAGTRMGAFGELDRQFGSRLRLTGGVRADRSSLTNAATVDPRLSAAFAVREGVTLLAATGVYHQVPDPLTYVNSVGGAAWPSMRATQRILGAEAGGEAHTVRIELYGKRYRDLVAFDADYQAHGGGTGRARGVDVLARSTLPLGLSVRGVLSAVRSERTDPATGLMARAPFDIPRSASAVVDWRIGGYALAAGFRWAHGRPFTPVVGATRDDGSDRWVPVRGDPMGERLPAFRRVDVSISHMRRYANGLMRVVFVSVANALDRSNVTAYYYSPDYSVRSPVPGIFDRSVYFGAMIGAR